MEKTRHVFYLRDTWRRQQLSPWIHLSWLGLWWDWELFVFIICMQKHLFTVTRPTSELLKSQSKQRSGNICCLDVYSLLTKLEDKKEKKEEYHQFWRIANDRKITIFRLICAKPMKNILCGEEGLKRNGIACHFGIKITSWRCLDAHFQFNKTMLVELNGCFLTCFVLRAVLVFSFYAQTRPKIEPVAHSTPPNKSLHWKTKCCNLLWGYWEALIIHRLIDCKNVCVPRWPLYVL